MINRVVLPLVVVFSGAACGPASSPSDPSPSVVAALGDGRFSASVVNAVQAHGAAPVIVTFAVPALDRPTARLFGHPDRAAALTALRNAADGLIARLPGQRIRRRFDTINALALTVDANGLEALRNEPSVVSVASDQGGAGNLREAVPLSRLDVVQATGLSGAGVTIAMLDSGIDRTHPDLSDSLVGEACFCSGSTMGDGTGCCPNGAETQTGAGAAADDNGHGTNVAGILTSNGTIAPKGGAPGSSVVVVKVLDASNSFTFSSDVIAGFDWIINNRPDVKIVNASLGTWALYPGACDGNADATPWKTAIDTLRANNVLVFASSGNASSSTAIDIPACITNTVAVGAVWDSNVGSQSVFCTDSTTAADKITCFTNSDSALDLLAPGAPTTSTGLGGGTSTYYGTSQASPLAAACAALLEQSNGALTAAQIETALEASPTRITDARNGLAFPRLDCGAALTSLSSSGSSALPRTGWTATASSTGGTDVPARALDGNASTRWSTGAAQANGQWFKVDMKAVNQISKLVLDATGSSSDYPRGYSVTLSNDDVTYGSPVAAGSGTSAIVTITFATHAARFVKITQTGSASNWWSIHELNVYGTAGGGGTLTAYARTGWVASAQATSGADVPARALDGNTSTRWSDGIPQSTMTSPAQYFQVDMGVAQPFSQLTLDAAGSANDYLRNYRVLVGDTNPPTTSVASGTATGALTTISFPSQTARYIRVVQTAASSGVGSWWSIAELNVWH